MNQPLLIPIIYEGEPSYQLVEPWMFWHGVNFTVPKGFVCDGASIPRVLWDWKPPDGTHRAAALAHDWLYVNKGISPVVTRRECDEVFLELLRKASVDQAWLLWLGVRIGGWKVWNQPKVGPVVIPVRNTATRITPDQNKKFQSHLYHVEY